MVTMFGYSCCTFQDSGEIYLAEAQIKSHNAMTDQAWMPEDDAQAEEGKNDEAVPLFSRQAPAPATDPPPAPAPAPAKVEQTKVEEKVSEKELVEKVEAAAVRAGEEVVGSASTVASVMTGAFDKIVHALGTWSASGLGQPFTVTVEKTAGSSIGLQVDCLEKTYVLVSKVISGGLIEAHNSSVKESEKVQIYDRLTQVNGQDCTMKDFVGMLSSPGTYQLTFQRPQAKKVVCNKPDRTSLGLAMSSNAEAPAVHIAVVSPGSHEDSGIMLRASDRVIDANGVHGCSHKILKVLQQSLHLDLTILSFHEDPPREEHYTMEITTRPIGLQFDSTCNDLAIISAVTIGGAIDAKNKAAKAELQSNKLVVAHDRLLKVNGATGTRDELRKMCEGTGALQLTFQRPQDKKVTLQRDLSRDGDPLGLQLVEAWAGLYVVGVTDPRTAGGIVETDRIVAVNGVCRDSAAMMQALKDSSLALSFKSYTPSGSRAHEARALDCNCDDCLPGSKFDRP
eukprot:TRINITY_DN12842_c1_g1_i1.p1 TRINITY_DN12842_c1_g1~~TRINITY_DN12842_c1_g1_i1.p1  ORF type:complete len:509 (+),score=109.58 TRINITY_DN12842_c1_g1_i1:86-1612(+)